MSPRNVFCLPNVAVTLARPLHVSKDGQSKEKGKTKQATLISDFHAHGRALFGRFVWRGINIYDVTIHTSRDSRINPTRKVCEHNPAAHASMAPDKGHLLEELGWMTRVAWKKQQKEEINKTKRFNVPKPNEA